MSKNKVNEIFWSIQGEGARAGISSVFLRLSGCSLGCHYCDSKSAWENGEFLDTSEIIKRIVKLYKKYPASQVVITGGEPFEQNIENIVGELKKRDIFIAVETNGIHFSNLPIDWWTVSPKDVNGFAINDSVREKISEIKLIVNENLKIKTVEDYAAKNEFPVFLQPQHPDIDRYEKTFSFFEKCSKKGIKNVRLGIQMHRIFKIR